MVDREGRLKLEDLDRVRRLEVRLHPVELPHYLVLLETISRQASLRIFQLFH